MMWQILRKRMGARNGFTLIELVVVVAILGILAVVVTPKVMGAIDNAKTSSQKSSSKQIQVGLERMFAETSAYPTGPVMCGAAWTALAPACAPASIVDALKNYVSLDAATILATSTYDPADAAGYKLILNFKDGKTFTVTPGSVN